MFQIGDKVVMRYRGMENFHGAVIELCSTGRVVVAWETGVTLAYARDVLRLVQSYVPPVYTVYKRGNLVFKSAGRSSI